MPKFIEITKWKIRKWETFLGFAFLAGILLRVTWVNDMEYKEDEEYNFTQTQLIGTTQPWPWYGIPSGVFLVNPGMSIWIFAVLAKILGIHEPTHLATAVQLFALLGMSLIIPFALKIVQKEDQKTWLWAFALAMVNPFLILYQRKLWPEPFLPFFTLITLMGWWTRRKPLGAWAWGMIGAWLGQIHMSGFFFSAALAIWTFFFDSDQPKKQGSTRWNFWFLGSIVGALPLIPWLIYIIQHPVKESISPGWTEVVQLKYWAFWLTDPLGLHLGNPLGLLRGESNWAQISDFVRYPLFGGQGTYIVGFAHLLSLISALGILGVGLLNLSKRIQNRFKSGRKNCLFSLKNLIIDRSSETALVQSSAFFGCGILMTATGIIIRRYYMAVTFPLEFIFLIRMAGPHTQTGKRLLIGLWLAELIMSAGFVDYIHTNQGSTYGDYGPAYHLRGRSPGK